VAVVAVVVVVVAVAAATAVVVVVPISLNILHQILNILKNIPKEASSCLENFSALTVVT
jgi:hypothetical protein